VSARAALAALTLAAATALATPAHAQAMGGGLADESAAYAEGLTPWRLNPAGASTRYPHELAIGWLDVPARRTAVTGALEGRGFRVTLGGAPDRVLEYSLGFGAGADEWRQGIEAVSRHDGARRVTDWRYGFLARPVPWLSLGGVADHLGRPRFAGATLERAYDLALGVRPLALDRGRAHTLGTRLTLTLDARITEVARLRDAAFRGGAELEIVPGVALRGSYEDRTHAYRLGVAVMGVRGRADGLASYDRGGRPLGRAYAVSTHDAEDRTVFAGPRERRIAVVRVGGLLGDDALGGLTYSGPSSVAPVAPLRDQLERAAADPLTRGVLLDLRGVANFAQLEELRARVTRLRGSGKPVVAYLEYGASRGDLYLASACDRIVTTPEAMFAGLGLLVEKRYWRKPLADLGVRLDRTSYGKYKSAYREYSVDSTSAADREALDHTLDTVQELFASAIAESRHMDRARLDTLLDGRSWRADDVRAAGLVDSVGDAHTARAVLGALCGLGAKPRAVRLAARPEARREWTLRSPVAVVYASGAIATGRSGNDFLMGPVMGSETVTRQVEAAFRNPRTKAVVLRVESPGGSSTASSLIAQTLARMKRETKKPLIVSMGRSAASGGYEISLPGDRLYADRFTYTGSIGVLFVRPSLQGFYAKHDVHQDDFARGDYQRGWGIGHDWDARLQAAADSSTQRDYRAFVSAVAGWRKLPVDDVDASAQGRVWMGDDACAKKLVDEIGGLDAALAEARRRAGVPPGEKIRTIDYRRPRGSLLQRWAGSLVHGAMQDQLRLPEPGSTLRYDDTLPE